MLGQEKIGARSAQEQVPQEALVGKESVELTGQQISAIKEIVDAIDAIPEEKIRALNLFPELWNTHNAVISLLKDGFMRERGVSNENWNKAFDGYERFS